MCIIIDAKIDTNMMEFINKGPKDTYVMNFIQRNNLKLDWLKTQNNLILCNIPFYKINHICLDVLNIQYVIKTSRASSYSQMANIIDIFLYWGFWLGPADRDQPLSVPAPL